MLGPFPKVSASQGTPVPLLPLETMALGNEQSLKRSWVKWTNSEESQEHQRQSSGMPHRSAVCSRKVPGSIPSPHCPDLDWTSTSFVCLDSHGLLCLPILFNHLVPSGAEQVRRCDPFPPCAVAPPWRVAWRTFVSLSAMVQQLHECHLHLADRPDGPTASHLPAENTH